METQANNARTEGATSEIEFKTKNLNVWTDTAATWITQEVLNKCRSTLTEIPEGANCLGGLDLSKRHDMTTFTLYATDEGVFQTWYFCPAEKLEDRKNADRVNYKQFAADGHLIVTDGNVIDYDFVKNKILELAKTYHIMCIGYDPFNSSQLVINLTDEGLDLIEFRQSFLSMSPPTKELEVMIEKREVTYIQEPIIEWMFSNVEIKINADGEIKADKGRGRNKIDGVISMIIAYGLSMSDDYSESVYNTMKVEEDEEG